MSNNFIKFVKWFGTIFLTVFVEYMLVQSGTMDIIKQAFNSQSHLVLEWLNIPIRIWSILLFVLIGSLFYFVFIKLFPKKDTVINSSIPKKSKEERYYNLKDKFKEENKFQTLDEVADIAFKSTIVFSHHELRLDSIEPYCTLHESKVKMTKDASLRDSDFHCSKVNCTNSITGISRLQKIRNEIFSNLEAKWDNESNEFRIY